jgi:hypothetical protein
MKKIFVGLFCFFFILFLTDLPSPLVGEGLGEGALAQIGSQTYQRVNNPMMNPSQSKPDSQTAVPAASTGVGTSEKSLIEWHLAERVLGIGEDRDLTFPVGLKECKVYDMRSLEKAIIKATWKGDCEWIKLRSSSDWDPMAPIWMQMEKPLVLEDKYEAAKGHPLVITNDSGRAIIFKGPKNEGCAVIIKKPDVAILGFTFEGAVCH